MFGCVDRYAGDNCTTLCESTCKTCLQHDNLYCLACNNGYTGTTCQCPPNCNCASGSDICASCTVGYANTEHQCKCQSQYCRGDSCNECIDQTFYADNEACCKCPDTCKGGVCKSGPECISGCIDGFYGLDCSIRCSSLNANCSICNRSDGMCLECKNGLYPHGNGSCISCNSNCESKQCNSKTGICTNGCLGKFWGDKCDMQCDSNCETCQQESGICDSCYKPTVYGSYCNESCSSSCLENKCDQRSGHCSIGCEGDFFGYLCQTMCPENCQQSGTGTKCNFDGNCKFGCVDGYEGDACTKSQVCTGSSTIIALAVLSGVLGILLICTAAGCYLWSSRRSKPKEQISTIEFDQRDIDLTYEQLQGQSNEQTYRNVDDNYTVLSNVHNN
ncbi:multiple epidermal growth factor-like domains protein 6 [Mya arenaria]|uniref:multiple epidermal growth factor-like domains protein 6 n=1 Tax=Mya arenaria TaxID=6604 RepID=UPI0022E4F31E|nr:multiple epidermal growth factor-like domains protein 6 [Mya arenaria]